jgi:hypothetical protein
MEWKNGSLEYSRTRKRLHLNACAKQASTALSHVTVPWAHGEEQSGFVQWPFWGGV